METVLKQDASSARDYSDFGGGENSPNPDNGPNLDLNTNSNSFQFLLALNSDLNLNLDLNPGNNDSLNDDDQLQGDLYNLVDVIIVITHTMHPLKHQVKPKAHKPNLFDGSNLKKLLNFIFQLELYF